MSPSTGTQLWLGAIIALAVQGATVIPVCSGEAQDNRRIADHPRQSERDQMVAQQVIPRGVTHPAVLAAMRRVPRHRFVPRAYSAGAYTDRPLPIGHGQTISQPSLVALMTEALALHGREKVLEVGTGSGYQAAILAELVPHVFTIEIVEPLAAEASRTLAELGYTNVHIRAGDGYRGWPEEAPFDAIIVTAASNHVPQPLLDQLAVGGRLILPVGEEVQRLVLYRRTQEGYEQTVLAAVRFVPMTGQASPSKPRER